ncbi:MAG: DUF4389 domain-containing protein [Dehalococcoidia bacterium]|jgi:hypothetical protein|nr:hypothetical protein [Chloroflexota bacterium]MDP6055830.1 DUF4389 domain-containing protein [Dehalococcoidia bacterium]MDP7089873.1 DUF4389 domain-containing protein [Dehalococcoidia bacterium]MDP7485440.1 DUF4389 domain-containing protein [Dehalococcoidia bacterium]|tara:strand:- start:1955 stop:2545 length:591 start_codon:yes stop_codon:yes gene_type:complete
MTTADQSQSTYPARLDIDYVSSNRNRLTTFFRLITSIPMMVLFTALGFSTNVIFMPVVLMLLFRQKYPRWWFDFNLEMQRFSTRFTAYMSLLTDVYPSTDETQSVHMDLDYPDAQQLNRWLPLIKWFLAIPHYIALVILGQIAVIAIVVSWFIILFTGSFPKGIHDYLVGVNRWIWRVTAYAFLLNTDEYPPFSLD